MEKITIKNKAFNYTPETLTYENATILDIDVAKENLTLFNDISKKNNFFFLLFYGTLLGAIRENDFIKHDIDIDLITNDEDGLLKIIPILLENGFNFIRYESKPSLHSFKTLYSFKRKSVYIDVYIAYKEFLSYNLMGSYIPLKYVDEYINYDFIGSTFFIPQNYLKILKRLYGKNWKIPMKNVPGDFKPSRTSMQKLFSVLKFPFKVVKKIVKLFFLPFMHK